jgi:hypothetical protein
LTGSNLQYPNDFWTEGKEIGSRERKLEGVYTPIAMERVRKHLKAKELRSSIAQKSPEAVGSKGVE